MCLTLGSPTALIPEVVDEVIKPTRGRRNPDVLGAKGGRSTDSTDDSRPMKPGNSVEEKTLTIEKQDEEVLSVFWQRRADHRWSQNALRLRRYIAVDRGQQTTNHREDSGVQRTPTGRGKSWTRSEDNDEREPNQWKGMRVQQNQQDGESRADTKPENRRGQQPSGPSFKASIPGNPSRQTVTESVR